MMVRAIYESGALRLLDAVDLADGEVVELDYRKMNERDAARAALGDLVRWHDPAAPVPQAHISDEALWAELEAAGGEDDWASRYVLEDREERL